jgi:transglutaminase/protease-like cytokinesis protein 3
MKSSVLIVFIIAASCTNLRGQISDFPGTDFTKADSIAELHTAHSLKDLKGLAENLTATLLTDQEKFRSIFKWVCSNISVDYTLVTLNKRKRVRLQGAKLDKWNKKFNSIVFRTLLREHKTLCTGYAYLIRELAAHAGLTCEIVNGYAKPGGLAADAAISANHSWNLIRLNDKWYVCDATWSSGVFNYTSGEFMKKYNDYYFLTDPTLFARDHLMMR